MSIQLHIFGEYMNALMVGIEKHCWKWTRQAFVGTVKWL